MVQVTYPGVYIQEVPSGVRTITPVATSIGAFIGYFKEGPMNKAVEINGMTDFDRIFGGIDRRSEAYYQLYQFFLNGGSKAFVIRAGAGTGKEAPAKADVTVTNIHSGGSAVMTVSAANEGLWGNHLRVVIEHNAPGTFDMTVIRYDSDKNDASPVVNEPIFRNLSVNPTSGRYFKSFVNEESNLVQVEHDAFAVGTDPTTYELPEATGCLSAPVLETTLDKTTIGNFDGKKFDIDVRLSTSTGSDSVSKKHTATLKFDSAAPEDARQFRPIFEQAIRAAVDTSTPPETHDSLAGATVEVIYYQSTKEFRFLVHTDPQADDYDPQEYIEITNISTTDKTAETLGFVGAGISRNVQEYVLGTDYDFNNRAQVKDSTKGADGIMPDPTYMVYPSSSTDATALANGLKGNEANKEGMYALEDVDLFNILILPLAHKLPDIPMRSVVSEALTYCETKRAFAIVDIPVTIDKVQEMKDWMDGHGSFRDKNAAIYFPRLFIPDPKDEYRARSIGASGTMAGIYARTDSTRGVWKAPAGLGAKVKGITRMDYPLTDPENGSLNPLGINCMRTFPIHGPVAWGGRTLDGSDAAASEWKYISIRRLALMLSESLFRGTKWVVFEGNDEPTWAKVRQNVRAFMMSLFRQGAFQGDSPDKAFYVKCDGETTTAQDRNRGILNIEVGFAPLKPAEFVVIKIQQIPDTD